MTNPQAGQIGRDEDLWRRIHEDHYLDGRVTTAAFKDREMSVDIASTVTICQPRLTTVPELPHS